jgi:beta-mannosidase
MDYYGNWKGLHYRARSAFNPIKILTSPEDGNLNKVYIWVTSDLPDSLPCQLQLQWMDVYGKVLGEIDIPVVPSFERTLHVHTFDMKKEDSSVYKRSLLVGRITSDDGIQDRSIIWFTIPKKLMLPKVEFTPQISKEDGDIFITINSPVAVMGVGLDFNELDVHLSDNYFDLIPGETKRVKVLTPGLSVEKIEQMLTLFCVNNLEGSTKASFVYTLSSMIRRTFFKLFHLFQ